MQAIYAKYKVSTDTLEFKVENPSKEEIDQMKALGFNYAFGRKCNWAKWTPDREDFILSLGVEIVDDDSPDDVEGRVKRFEKYAQDAIQNSQSSAEYAEDANTERRRKLAAQRSKSEAERAEHWAYRIQGAIRHAAYKARPDVIARRIKGIEADLHKHEKEAKFFGALVGLWSADPIDMDYAVAIANRYERASISLPHPELEDKTQLFQFSLYSVLTNNMMPLNQVVAFAKEHNQKMMRLEQRWVEHLTDWLAFQRALLDSAGGQSTDKVKLEVGGAIKCSRGDWGVITKINKVTVEVKSRYDGSAGLYLTRIPLMDVVAVKSKAEWEAETEQQNA